MADDLKPKSEWELEPNVISQARREAARKALQEGERTAHHKSGRISRRQESPYSVLPTDYDKPSWINQRTGEYMRTMKPIIDEEGEFTPSRLHVDLPEMTSVSNVLDRGSHGDVRPEMIQEMGERRAADVEAQRHKRLLEHKLRSSEPGYARTGSLDMPDTDPSLPWNRDPQERTEYYREMMDLPEMDPQENRHYQDEIDYLKRFYGTK